MIRVLRLTLVALSVAFMILIVVGEWEKIRATAWTFRSDLLALSTVGAIALFFLDAYGWHLVLRALGHNLPPSRSMQVWLVSSLARYIPGGVWSYASRVALARAEGVSLATASLSLYLETLLLMMSSLAVGSVAMLWGAGLPLDIWSASGICVALGLLLHPRVLALSRRLPGRIGETMREVRLPTLRRILVVYLYYLVFWILFGVVFVEFVMSAHSIEHAYWVPVGAAIALGFFTGFILILVPGGIGVRESALYLLLLPFLPATASLVIAIGSRLWLMAGEGISLMLILLYTKTSGAKIGWRSP